jgi:hypothetical protein
VKVPEGIAASSDELSRADGHALSLHRFARATAGWRQQVGSGQRDVCRRPVSRPRNHFTCAKGVPTLTENAPDEVLWMLEVHQ